MKRWFLLNNSISSGKVLYINARITDPESGESFNGGLLTIGDKIADFGSDIACISDHSCFEEVIDCKGNLLIPGIIDIHVHLRDPGQTHKETIHTGTKSAAAGGVTTVVCQPNTTPNINSVETLSYIKRKAKSDAYVNVEAYANITKNGEKITDILSLYEAGAVGFTDDGLPVMNPHLMKQVFSYAAHLNAPIAQHAEDLFLSNNGCINEGGSSSRLNLPGISDLSESVMVARDIMLLDSAKDAHYHILHISTEGAVKAVSQAKRDGLNVTCEVTPHHLLLNDDAVEQYNALAKMNPPLRSEDNRLKMIASLVDGTIDAIASDHAPHDPVSKNLPITKAAFGIVGVETMLPLSLELYHSGIIGLRDLLSKLTCNPAKIINSSAGRIKIGAPADLAVLDLDKEWTIDINELSSKSKNSPFHGRKVRGKVLRTVVSGKTVYIDQ